MKYLNKTLIILFGIIITAIVLFIPNKAYALTDFEDQWCRTVSTDGTIRVTDRTDLLQQTFTPSLDRLTRVTLSMNGDGVGTVSLWIVEDSDNGKYFISENGQLPVPNGLGTLSFSFGSINLTPGKKYIILPVASDDATLYWYYKENCYAKGEGYMGTVAKTFDYSFKTWGWSSGATIAPTSTPMPTFFLVDLNKSTPTPTSTGVSKMTTTPSATSTPQSTQSDFATVLPDSLIHDEIPAPVLQYALNDLEKLENIAAVPELTSESNFVLFGTGEKNSKVLIIVGDKSYLTDVSKSGEWFLKIPINEFDNGTYLIKGQTILNGAGSPVLDLMNIKVKNNLLSLPSVTKAQDDSKNYFPYILYGGIILIGLVLLGIYFYIRRKTKMKKMVEEKPESVDATKAADDINMPQENNSKQLPPTNKN